MINGYKIAAFWGSESNPHADAAHAGDGGGYFQPCGGAVARLKDGRDVVVCYDDRSCGEFGTRIWLEIDAGDLKWSICYGNMDDACCQPWEALDAVLASCSGCLGIDAWALLEDVEYLINQAAYKLGKEESA